VQGDERKNTMKFVEHQLPRAYHLKCLSNLSEEEIESGCRDSAPSKTVLKQIRYEARKVLTPFEDESKSLSEIHSQQQQYYTGMIKGTLQMILSRPRGIILFSESTVRIYHSLARTDIVYVDATGSVLLGDKSCYAYEIVVRHPNEGNPPLAVASYFATSHNIPSISYFLQSFCHAESTLYRKRSLPKLLMCDGSTALMNAIVLSMFKETFKNYLHRCWLIASGKYTSSFCELPILHLCASHFMKNAKKLVKER